ncbi:P-loop containing nucleoside triphosphate hydrolase protein [Whalleya microplaca]|nr:P-loop containing nucleoside triphosphate hydrolase protein [Whalleya microplaca]
MADPLSIAASVAGLLTLSSSIHKVISTYIARTVNISQSVFALLLNVSEMRLALTSVSNLVDSFVTLPPRRLSMVQLDHLVICITGSVLAFDDLQKFMGTWPEDALSFGWRRWRWARQEGKMLTLTDRIQQCKTSISLVLNILQCESDIEARQSRETLHITMQKVLDESKDLRTKIGQLGSAVQSTAQSVRSYAVLGPPKRALCENSVLNEDSDDEDTTSTIREQQNDSEIISSHDPNEDRRSWPFSQNPAISPGSNFNTLSRPSTWLSTRGARQFETILAQSRVYARNERHDCDISFSTSCRMSGLWSMLSGLSLSQVSKISIIALPLSLNDILDSSWYRPGTVPRKESNIYKIAVLGVSHAGKSALATKFCHNFFLSCTEGPIKATLRKNTIVDDSPCQLEVTVTSGWGEYELLTEEAILEAEGCIIVYSIADFYSFEQIRRLYSQIIGARTSELLDDRPVVIVGTKSDLDLQRSVPYSLGDSVATELGCKFFECSAKLDENVSLPFEELVRVLRLNRNHTVKPVSS